MERMHFVLAYKWRLLAGGLMNDDFCLWFDNGVFCLWFDEW
jgi:hypothetical protein